MFEGTGAGSNNQSFTCNSFLILGWFLMNYLNILIASLALMLSETVTKADPNILYSFLYNL
jgi:hypothetical protein